MAKKGKDEVPGPSSVANRDILQRMNFLYQASAFLNNLAQYEPETKPQQQTPQDSVPGVPPLSRSAKKRQKRKEKILARHKQHHPATCSDLARSYVTSMRAIGQKTNVKLDPAVKRTLCKSCNVVLIAGATATVRIKPSLTHGSMMEYTCTSCKTIRRIPAPPLKVAPPNATQSEPASTSHDTEMAVDSSSNQFIPENYHFRKGRVRNWARVPPLFDRDVGHVLFKGNEEAVIKDTARFMCS